MAKQLSILKDSYETDQMKNNNDLLKVVTFKIMGGRKYDGYYIRDSH